MHAPPRAAKPQARSDPKSWRTDSDTLSARPFSVGKRGVRYPLFQKQEVPPPMAKQYAILRVQKCKGAAIGAMQYHNDREPGKHTNPTLTNPEPG